MISTCTVLFRPCFLSSCFPSYVFSPFRPTFFSSFSSSYLAFCVLAPFVSRPFSLVPFLPVWSLNSNICHAFIGNFSVLNIKMELTALKKLQLKRIHFFSRSCFFVYPFFQFSSGMCWFLWQSAEPGSELLNIWFDGLELERYLNNSSQVINVTVSAGVSSAPDSWLLLVPVKPTYVAPKCRRSPTQTADFCSFWKLLSCNFKIDPCSVHQQQCPAAEAIPNQSNDSCTLGTHIRRQYFRLIFLSVIIIWSDLSSNLTTTIIWFSARSFIQDGKCSPRLFLDSNLRNCWLLQPIWPEPDPTAGWAAERSVIAIRVASCLHVYSGRQPQLSQADGSGLRSSPDLRLMIAAAPRVWLDRFGLHFLHRQPSCQEFSRCRPHLGFFIWRPLWLTPKVLLLDF